MFRVLAIGVYTRSGNLLRNSIYAAIKIGDFILCFNALFLLGNVVNRYI